MSIPKFDELFELTIEAIGFSGGTASIYAIEEYVADKLELSEDERMEVHNLQEGKRTELGYRLAWSRNYLKNAGLIENKERTVWELTETGKNIKYLDRNEIKKSATEEQIQRDVELNDIDTDIYNDEIEDEQSDNSIVIDEPFDPKKVDIKSKTMILEAIFRRLENNEIDLYTGFQRKGGLWDKTKQSRLIESILIRFPLPAFYFDGSNDDRWLVVDGLQRLTTLKNFILDKNLALEKMEFLHQFNGLKFNNLPRDLQRRIEEFEITVYVINPGTPEKVKYNVFKRINTGGLVLSSQEIRHALNQGVPSDFVKELADSKEFKIATTYSISSDRMMDRDFANRFVAFYINPVDSYRPDLDSFLNESLSKLKNESPDELEKIKNAFIKAMRYAHDLFDIYAFRKRYSRTERRKPINKALFEVWSVLLAKLSDGDLEKLKSRSTQLEEGLMKLMNSNNEFYQSISSGTGGIQQVKTRFREIENLIERTLES